MSSIGKQPNKIKSTCIILSEMVILTSTHVNIPMELSPHEILLYMSLVMKKPAFGICENKDADQLRGNREADLRLCFRYTNSAIPLLSKSEISSF